MSDILSVRIAIYQIVWSQGRYCMGGVGGAVVLDLKKAFQFYFLFKHEISLSSLPCLDISNETLSWVKSCLGKHSYMVHLRDNLSDP